MFRGNWIAISLLSPQHTKLTPDGGGFFGIGCLFIWHRSCFRTSAFLPFCCSQVLRLMMSAQRQSVKHLTPATTIQNDPKESHIPRGIRNQYSAAYTKDPPIGRRQWDGYLPLLLLLHLQLTVTRWRIWISRSQHQEERPAACMGTLGTRELVTSAKTGCDMCSAVSTSHGLASVALFFLIPPNIPLLFHKLHYSFSRFVPFTWLTGRIHTYFMNSDRWWCLIACLHF